MALVKIICPFKWYNVGENKDNNWITAVNKDAMQKVYLPPGNYEDGTALIEALRFAQDIGTKFSFNRATGRLSLKFSFDRFAYIQMSDDLKSFVGFEDLPDCEKSFDTVRKRDFEANSRLNLMHM
jgi:hypothetical protein